MKVGIRVFFEFSKNVKIEIKEENGYHIVEWKHPILPRVGDHIAQVSMFLSPEMQKQFKSIKLIDFFSDDYIKEFYYKSESEETLFDFYNEVNSDPHIVEKVYWVYTQEDGHYPVLEIVG